ncbi:hypothetical protein [Cupriavidus sp. TMH.W2]|uniref:hypothetical protein n=1 Tax=Cupriavidus sp. TMH.W2 TaxID=3434465 RepID=UPI003D77A40F
MATSRAEELKFVPMKRFLSMATLPVHAGEYEVQLPAGAEKRTYREGWQGDMAGAAGWRGIRLSGSPRQSQRAMKKFSGTDASTHPDALQAAVYLARHRVGRGDNARAAMAYMVAHRIDPKRLHAVDLAWQAQFMTSLGAGARKAIEDEVETFFMVRGQPKQRERRA